MSKRENTSDNYMDDFVKAVFACMTPYRKLDSQVSSAFSDCGDYYQLQIDLPGFSKEDVRIELKDNYVIVTAETRKEVISNDILKNKVESYSGKCCRTYYVGANVTKQDIEAVFERGKVTMKIRKNSNYIVIK